MLIRYEPWSNADASWCIQRFAWREFEMLFSSRQVNDVQVTSTLLERTLSSFLTLKGTGKQPSRTIIRGIINYALHSATNNGQTYFSYFLMYNCCLFTHCWSAELIYVFKKWKTRKQKIPFIVVVSKETEICFSLNTTISMRSVSNLGLKTPK